MVNKSKKVVWSEKAIDSLKTHCEHIKGDSASAAKKVRSEILRAAKEMSVFPEQYQVDEYYPNNPGNIRRFFRWSYRIVYEVNEKTVDILNVLHTSQEPEIE